MENTQPTTKSISDLAVVASPNSRKTADLFNRDMQAMAQKNSEAAAKAASKNA